MVLRVLRSNEPGTTGAGLVGVLLPEPDTHTFWSNREQRWKHAPDPIHESRVLVTIREPEREPQSFLLEGYALSTISDPTEFVQTQPTAGRISRRPRFRWISVSVTVALVALFAFVGIAGFTGLFSMRVVLTNSMQPTINPGDVVVAVSDTVHPPQLGDVVIYIGKTFDGTPVAPFAHRVIGGDAQTGWIVQGDNNSEADVQHPTEKDIESVVVATIPWVGKFLNVQFLLLVVALIFGVWLIVDGLRDRT